MSDLQRVSKELRCIIRVLVGNSHAPPILDNSDSITVTKNGYLQSLIRLQRLDDWDNYNILLNIP